jgi:hypothetical protein
MKKIALIGTAALLSGTVLGFGMTPAKAVTATFTETTSGIVQAVNGATVASDGEVAFNPFNNPTGDTSDGIILPTLLNGAGAPVPWTFTGTGWTNVTGNTWVLGSVIPGCGSENEPTCEPVGTWTNSLLLPAADLGLVKILDSDGTTLSDVINFSNVGAEGSKITFASDPLTPLPGALPLFATGIGGLGLLGWRRKRKASGL